MIVNDYSSALFELLAKGSQGDALLESLQSLLKKKGHERLYASILKDLLAKFEKDKQRNSIQVMVGREKDIPHLKESILEAMATLGTEKEFLSHVDTTLIGGFKIKSHDKVIDRSYKKQLLTIYRSLTT